MKTLKSLAILSTVLFAAASSEAALFTYNLSLSGPNESPTNLSPGIGSGTVTINDATFQMVIAMVFSGLTGTTTAAHIHAATATAFTGTAGVASTSPSFAGFPLGVTTGSYNNTLDMTQSGSYNASYITANGGTTTTAFTALKAAADAGKTYFNIHTSTFGGGEIRSFLTPVPEPTSAALLAIGAGVGLVRRRRSIRA